MCPKCDKKMTVNRQNTCNNPDNGKEYHRVVWECKECDIWVIVEEPVKN